MKHLGIEKAVLVGCSLGGEIILDFYLEHPEMVKALVLVSTVPGGFEMQGEPPQLMMEMISALEQKDVQRASALQVQLLVDGPFRKPEQVDAQVRSCAAEMNRIAVENGTWLNVDMQPFQLLDPPAAARLKEIRVPALIIAGALDDPEIVRVAGYMEKAIPTAKRIIIPDAAHVLTMEQPAAFNDAVLAFLQTNGL